MKSFYLLLIILFASLITFIPQRIFAQCLCSGGVAPSTITYEDTLSPTNAASSTISFPQFDPSIGILSCVNFTDTISGVTTTNVANLASSKTLYKFLLTVANNISGPGGISVNEDYTKNYGPDSLNAAGNSPGDSITYGPDSLFLNVRDSTNTGSTASYLGSGTVGFDYTLNGGLISLEGSLNYWDQIITNYWGTFRLTYYWCPANILASIFNNFTAAKNGDKVQIKWQTENEQKGISYDIEYSTDGSNYISAGKLQSSDGSEGSTAMYQFLFNIPQGENNGLLYFKIKRSSTDGKTVVYSDVKTVNLSSVNIAAHRAYPNPARSFTMIEFDHVQYGDFNVELISTTGQVLENKMVSLSGSSQIEFDFSSHPATGVYYLKVKNNTKNQQYISKLIIE